MFKSPFIATRLQVTTYLLGVALFSISFLVFLNASISFVIVYSIGEKEDVGDAAGTLGFADEVVALVACPLWGLLSDRLGVRNVVTIGYAIVGVSLFIFVQAKNVYPELLLARLFFSVGGAATSTMVTAILPATTSHALLRTENQEISRQASLRSNHAMSPSVSSEATLTPATFQSTMPPSIPQDDTVQPSKSATSQVAGLVGMFTGLGALIALFAFLPLPARFEAAGYSWPEAVTSSFYIVGSIAFIIAIFCFVGLRYLPGEANKGWKTTFRSLRQKQKSESERTDSTGRPKALYNLFLESAQLGFTDVSIGLGYLGGFVARASSVGISLFIPLFVNHYFRASGLCKEEGSINDPADVKEQCRRAYTLAAELSGISQAVALVGAPIFGWVDGRFRRFNLPLLFAALCGVVGYSVFARLKSPRPSDEGGWPGVFVCMILLGLSQIGAIVCSLSLLGRGIEGSNNENNNEETSLTADAPEYVNREVQRRHDGTVEQSDESQSNDRSPLLPSHLQRLYPSKTSRSHLKGTIAGLYSLAGGAGILLLTKLGGHLFDTSTPGAPFYMLAIFNGILLVVGLSCGVGVEIRKNVNRVRLS